ncbi:putative phage tail protein [Clostridium sp.]|uniref:putative phage tail protein n=1 Tax=Clostridium sp. TaxID=1506 RepID=UPI00290C8778|nr:putative phage tail protein [Clostridium sp.]MDU4726405.1 putative phage tail protein [Clostridium sp.]
MYGNNIYGTIEYSKYSNPNNIDEKYKIDLMKYLPYYYQTSEIMKSIQNSNSIEVGNLIYNIDDSINQFFVESATWCLNRLEKIFNIQTDINKSYEDRREVLKAKIRGSGTVTKEMIKNVSQAFSGGEVEVIEDNSKHSFIIKFIGIKGIPKNMQGLIEIIEDIKPAHLGYSFAYTYTTWDSIKSRLTWEQASLKTWNELKTYE